MIRRGGQMLLLGGFTAVFIGYFTVWLPGPGVGLSFLGVELGEWIKFLGVGSRRNLFYLPPITLGLMLILWTVFWPPRRWQTWATRGVGVVGSLLSFPAIAAIVDEPGSEWVLRLLLIALVVLTAALSDKIRRLPPSLVWVIIAGLGLIGLVLPTWCYLALRPYVSQVIGVPIGIGVGVWLNGCGHFLITAVAIDTLRQQRLPQI